MRRKRAGVTALVVCLLVLAETIQDGSPERLPGTRRRAFQAVPRQWLGAGEGCRARNAVLLQRRCAVRGACGRRWKRGRGGVDLEEEGCGFRY